MCSLEDFVCFLWDEPCAHLSDCAKDPTTKYTLHPPRPTKYMTSMFVVFLFLFTFHNHVVSRNTACFPLIASVNKGTTGCNVHVLRILMVLKISGPSPDICRVLFSQSFLPLWILWLYFSILPVGFPSLTRHRVITSCALCILQPWEPFFPLCFVSIKLTNSPGSPRKQKLHQRGTVFKNACTRVVSPFSMHNNHAK